MIFKGIIQDDVTKGVGIAGEEKKFKDWNLVHLMLPYWRGEQEIAKKTEKEHTEMQEETIF